MSGVKPGLSQWQQRLIWIMKEPDERENPAHPVLIVFSFFNWECW